MKNTENQAIISAKILLAILGAIVIIVLGFILFIQYNKESDSPTRAFPGTTIPAVATPSVPVEANVVDPVRVAEILREAIDTQDSSLCERLGEEKSEKSCKASVILAEAGIKEDPRICDQLEDQAEIMICKDNVIITQAMNARDSSLCNDMLDEARIEGCKADVAALK